MPSPARAELRAAFAKALNRAGYSSNIVRSDASAIRAAVEVVLPEPPDPRRAHPDLLRRRAALLALADAIEGGD
jgi:hypothetical protein